MRTFFSKLRDAFIAGIIFLLPLLILAILISKVLQKLAGISSKIASFFGLKSLFGVSGGTIISGIAIILFCILCGYIVRLSFFRFMSEWTDRKLRKYIPGYEVYREMAMSKLKENEEALPYESAAWAEMFGMLQPCFLMEIMPDGKYVIFFPTAGETKQGIVLVTDSDKVKLCRDVDMRTFRNAISNLGLGLGKIPLQPA